MPLHLLGKKSWNVYNTVNIEKVRKDEAVAATKEAEEDERMQALDAERRMQILRGEEPTPLPIEEASSTSSKHDRAGDRSHGSVEREKKRRKKAGENDTDFEMRVAREQAEDLEKMGRELVLRKDTKVGADAPLTDARGHISLFPQTLPKRGEGKGKEKNTEVEAEKERKKKEYENQYTMRFSNAAGFKQSLGDAPWYEKGVREEAVEESTAMVGKDVWGNDDPRRKQREMERIVSSDPLVMMKAGARMVREVERERRAWKEQRERDVRELDEAEVRERRRKRKRRSEDDDVEDIRLDEVVDERDSSRSKRRSRVEDRERGHRHRESKRDSYREDDGHKHRHRHRHHHRE